MPDPPETTSADPPARRGGPRHAAPENGGSPDAAVSTWHSAPAAAGRSAHRRRRSTRGSGGRRRRQGWPRVGPAGGALAAVIAVVVAAVVVGLVREGAGGTAAAPGTDGPGAPVPTGAPPGLLAWLRTELPVGGTVTATAPVRDVLVRAGADPAVLPESAPPWSGDPAVPVLVLTETEPGGSRVLARFDRDGAVPLLLVDPAPVEPAEELRRQRESLAAAVLANPATRTEGDTREVLASGEVDPRLLTLIAGLTAREGVGLWEFPSLPGEQGGTAPARRVVVDAVGDRPVPADGAATQRLVAWLDAQLAPLAPDTVEVTGDGVLVGFAYVPGPDAVVAAAGR
ncbi:hypothetical protein [Trujillonella humicola]|uniref:hypothetical protein n=1 Tax=Trujillonella humicola TaxID=3383699 RepID=UPI00390689CF